MYIVKAIYKYIRTPVVGGAAIIAAIIGILSVVSALLVAISKLATNGSTKIVEKAKEIKQNIEAKNISNNSSSINNLSQDKKDEIILSAITTTQNSSPENVNTDSTDVSVKNGLVKYTSVEESKKNIIGLSMIDFTDYINTDCIKELNDICNKVWDSLDNGKWGEYIKRI